MGCRWVAKQSRVVPALTNISPYYLHKAPTCPHKQLIVLSVTVAIELCIHMFWRS